MMLMFFCAFWIARSVCLWNLRPWSMVMPRYLYSFVLSIWRSLIFIIISVSFGKVIIFVFSMFISSSSVLAVLAKRSICFCNSIWIACVVPVDIRTKSSAYWISLGFSPVFPL
uniref:Uncharacterized protein n=1 Tax=Anopheles darlingi TaxID=43151 RepID=A0A2M4D564_ANODA